MVAPITGPFVQVSSSGSTLPSSYRYRRWYRQRKPYTKSLAWSSAASRYTRASGSGTAAVLPQFESMFTTGVSATPSASLPNAYKAVGASYANAITRFSSVVKGPSAELGVTFVERKEAYQLVTKRMGTLLKFSDQLLKRNPEGVHRALRLKKPTLKQRLKIRKRSNELSGLYLEYLFGWMPLVQDIYSAIDVLQSPFPQGRMSATSRWVYSKDTWSGNAKAYCSARLKTKISAVVTVSNPSLFRANQLGLVNPATIAFDVVTLSFILGWVLSVKEFLNQFTAFAGVSLSDISVTRLRQVGDCLSFYSNGNTYVHAEGFRCDRELYNSLPLPGLDALHWKLPGDLGGKAASLAALLVQSLTKVKKG